MTRCLQARQKRRQKACEGSVWPSWFYTTPYVDYRCQINPSLTMKNTLFYTVFTACVLAACTTAPTEKNTSYEQNVASMKAMFDGFQNKSIDNELFADDFVDVGTGFEDIDRGKTEAMQQWKMMTSIMDAELVNALYLPGIDTTTMAVDGSVRYYGKWKMTMGEATQSLMAYGSMEFNDAGKIRNFAHYADWTATFNALLAENPEIAARLAQRATRNEQ